MEPEDVSQDSEIISEEQTEASHKSEKTESAGPEAEESESKKEDTKSEE